MQAQDAEGQHTVIAFRLDLKLDRALREAAQKNERSVSAEIRHALKQHLKEAA